MNSKQEQHCRAKPYFPENVELLARMHLLSLLATANYSLDFDECGNEWCVTITYPGINSIATKSWTLLEHVLVDGIEILEKYMDEHHIQYPANTAIATKTASTNPALTLRYTRKQVQEWRDDIARACAEIAEHFDVDPFVVNAISCMARMPVLRPKPVNPLVEVVGYEKSSYDGPDTVTYGWQPWKQISETEYLEILEYIKSGYKYRVRKLYAEVIPQEDDRPNCSICHCRYLALHGHNCEPSKRGTRHVFFNYVDPVKE